MSASLEKARNLPAEPIRMVAPARRRIQTLTAVMITFARVLGPPVRLVAKSSLSIDLAKLLTAVP